MKLILSGLVALLALTTSVSGQLYISGGGLFVKSGSDYSFEGLQFVANGDQTIVSDTYTLSNTPVIGANGVSIAKVINLSSPYTFNGTFNLLYTEGQLNGNTETLLKFATRTAQWATNQSSTVDGAINIVQYVTNGNMSTDRFTATVATTTLPLAKYSFTAGVTTSQVQLQWLVEENDFYKGFQLEESNNGTDWTTVSYITALSADKQFYTFNDANSGFDKRFYRLRLDPKNGASTYSEIITVTSGLKPKKTLFITDKGLLTINFLQGAVPDQVLLLDNAGKTVYKAQDRQPHYLISNLRTGVYIVSYKLQGQSYLQKVMVK